MGDTGVIAYRLFRRDLSGAVHFEGLHFHPQDNRRDVMLALRAACHRLRGRVDDLDLASLEAAA